MTEQREAPIEVERRDDGSWDLVRRGDDHGGDDEVLSNHPLQSMAESERNRLAQQDTDEDPGPGDDEADLGTRGAYPDNTGG